MAWVLFEGSGQLMDYIKAQQQDNPYYFPPKFLETTTVYMSMAGMFTFVLLLVGTSIQAQKEIDYALMIEAWTRHANDCPCDA